MELSTKRSQFGLLVLGLLLAACGRNDFPGNQQVIPVGDPSGSARPNVNLTNSTGDSFQNGDNRLPSHKRRLRMENFRFFRSLEDEMRSSGSMQRDLQLYFPEKSDLPGGVWADYENLS